MKPYLAILRQAVQSLKHAKSLHWYYMLLLAPLPLAPFMLLTHLSWQQSLGLALGIPYAFLFFAWWMSYLFNALAQNTPINASLVPGLRRRLWVLTCLLALAQTVLLAGIAKLALGQFLGPWLVVAVVHIYLALIVRSSWAFALYLLVWFAGGQGYISKPGVASLAADWLGGMALVLAVLLLGALSFYYLLAGGGERHWRLQARQQKFKKMLRSDGMGMTSKASNGRGLWPYGWALRYALVKGAPPARLMCFGLGPSAYWGTFYLQFLYASLLLLAIWFAGRVGLYRLDTFWSLSSIALLPFTLLILLLPAVLQRNLHQTRQEQALLQLLPGVPQGRDLNRALGLHHLACYGATWLLLAISTAAAQLWLPYMPWLQNLMESLLAFGLVLAGLTLCDPARLKARADRMSIAILLLGALSSAVWLTLVHTRLAVPPLLLWGVYGLLAVGLLAYRWRRMLSAPPAFPAGRLAA